MTSQGKFFNRYEVKQLLVLLTRRWTPELVTQGLKQNLLEWTEVTLDKTLVA